MDPISAIFASYIELVSQKTIDKMSAALGTEIQSVAVEHHNTLVTYNYLMWNIQLASVCKRDKPNLAKYSNCTEAAQSLFNHMCSHFQQSSSSVHTNRRLKNMYCQAATNFTATTANISWSTERSSADISRAECNQAISKLLIEQSATARAHKEKVCTKR